MTASNAFAKNRAEELGFDLWNEFVVPLYYERLALEDVRKPLLIEGGRGCGKTTLLRYLSHRTQLSPHRRLGEAERPRQLGLYLRADTQYLRTFRGDDLGENEWLKVFNHALCLMILAEMLSALEHLQRGSDRQALFPGIDRLSLATLQDFDDRIPLSVIDAIEHVRREQNRLARWTSNLDVSSRPLLLPTVPVIREVIATVRRQVPTLAGVDFFVFVDEYENLLPYQMHLINTFLKHSDPPLIFHIAAKRNAMIDRRTLGNEQLQEPADFRVVDIEAHLGDSFPLFAAELYCFRLIIKGITLEGCPVTATTLCDVQQLPRRYADEYRISVLSFVQNRLPGMSGAEIADYVFNDATLRQRLSKELSEALKSVDFSLQAEDFMCENAKMESICCIALLRQNKPASMILGELKQAASAGKSKFVDAEWLHHYFTASVLYLYLPLQRPCPLYGGFGAFLKLASGNIRHFLELCHLSMQLIGDDGEKLDLTEMVEKQAAAARAASAVFVKEVQGSGDMGNRLYQVVCTLGQIFRYSQNRPSQSEPERTHFSIIGGAPSERAQEVLREAVKWSVLFQQRETKLKNQRLEAFEYVFNPIYAPYFGISYNKGRRLELHVPSAEQLLTGDSQSLEALASAFRAQWSAGNTAQLSLI